MKTVLILGLIVSIAGLHTASATKCYRCNWDLKDREGCKDPFTKNQDYIEDCPGLGPVATKCIKLTGETPSGEDVVVRSCALELPILQLLVLKNKQWYDCAGDYCNGSSRLSQVPVMMAMLPACLALLRSMLSSS